VPRNQHHATAAPENAGVAHEPPARPSRLALKRRAQRAARPTVTNVTPPVVQPSVRQRFRRAMAERTQRPKHASSIRNVEQNETTVPERRTYENRAHATAQQRGHVSDRTQTSRNQARLHAPLSLIIERAERSRPFRATGWHQIATARRNSDREDHEGYADIRAKEG